MAVLKPPKWSYVLVASLLHSELVKTAAFHFGLAQAFKTSVSQNKKLNNVDGFHANITARSLSLDALCAFMQNR